MPTTNRETLLSRYHYDPLDRLVNSSPFEQPTQRYYCKTRLATEIEGGVQRTIVQHDDQLLAQQRSEGGKTTATLLATDQQRSVLNALDANQPNPLAYTPYGHRPLVNGLLSLLGFTGERPDPVTGHYHLGNGYRQFNPVLMRFNSPDSWSPFGEGGLNAYAYCGGDSINKVDPDAHAFEWLKNLLGFKSKTKKIQTPKFPERTELHANEYIRNEIFSSYTFPGSEISNGNRLGARRIGDTIYAEYVNQMAHYRVAGPADSLEPMQLTHIWPHAGISGDTGAFARNIQNQLSSTAEPLNAVQIASLHPQNIRSGDTFGINFLSSPGPARKYSFNSRRQ